MQKSVDPRITCKPCQEKELELIRLGQRADTLYLVGNPCKSGMGHAYYLSDRGKTALCIAPSRKTHLSGAVTEEKTILLEDGSEADITAHGYIEEQQWILATSQNGINWAVPQGWPNNARPICQESEPEGYQAIVDTIHT